MDGDKITRAALVLFGKDPGRFFPNLVMKIGRFSDDDADLRFQETAEGNRSRVSNEVIELLQHKFLVKPVRFEGIHRIEEWEYPMAALREIVLNALPTVDPLDIAAMTKSKRITEPGTQYALSRQQYHHSKSFGCLRR